MTDAIDQTEVAKEDDLVMALWPDAGRKLKLGRSATYQAAERGEIPGLMRFGRRFVVAKKTFERALGVV